MKNFFYGAIALMVVSLAVLSCDNDDDNDRGYVLSQGVGDVYKIENKMITLLMDDADTVLITNSEKFNLQVGLRVSFVGDIISERQSGDNKVYEFRAARIDKVLTKYPQLQSVLNENKVLADSIGNDVINLYSAKIESKYLNINYRLWHQGIGTSHFINLVVDDVTSPIEVDANGELLINAELRHNAFGDEKFYESWGFVSFKIGDYLAKEGLKTIKMKIKFKTSSTLESIETVVYNVGSTTDDKQKSGISMSNSFVGERFTEAK